MLSKSDIAKRANASWKSLATISEILKALWRCRKIALTLRLSTKGLSLNHISYLHSLLSIYHSRLLYLINFRVLELYENGIFNHWDLWIRPYPRQCTANVNGLAEKQTKEVKLRRLSLKNLTGAFIILSIGLGLSFLVCMCERIAFLGSRSHGN